jgi:hypothetical protein
MASTFVHLGLSTLQIIRSACRGVFSTCLPADFGNARRSVHKTDALH